FALNHYELPTHIVLYEQSNKVKAMIVSLLRSLSYITYVLWIITDSQWLIRNKAYKGIKTAFKHWIMILRIRRMFLDSNYFVNRVYMGRPISQPLHVDLEFKDNGQATLRVENHLKYDSKLDGARLGSALGSYIVENDYITDDNNYYINDLLEYRTMMIQREFDEYERYKKWSTKDISDYELKIDDRLTVKYGHFLLVGQTGSGKTYALYHLILQSFMKSKKKRAQMHYVDPKGSSLMSVGKMLSPSTTPVPKKDEVSNYEAMKDEIEKVYNILFERQKEISPKLENERLDAD